MDPQETMEKIYDQVQKDHPDWTAHKVANEVVRIMEEAGW